MSVEIEVHKLQKTGLKKMKKTLDSITLPKWIKRSKVSKAGKVAKPYFAVLIYKNLQKLSAGQKLSVSDKNCHLF